MGGLERWRVADPECGAVVLRLAPKTTRPQQWFTLSHASSTSSTGLHHATPLGACASATLSRQEHEGVKRGWVAEVSKAATLMAQGQADSVQAQADGVAGAGEA